MFVSIASCLKLNLNCVALTLSKQAVQRAHTQTLLAGFGYEERDCSEFLSDNFVLFSFGFGFGVGVKAAQVDLLGALVGLTVLAVLTLLFLVVVKLNLDLLAGLVAR
mmetsp:Transcript_39184/g.51261  ORF Transcript_39184/g.51261 Transcript_39184/m.51261 type:complete len:107 (-) Transcript_39184:2483-2803(-)